MAAVDAAVRYVTLPRLNVVRDPYGEDSVLHGTTVYEPDDEPRPTGLLDAQGNKLFRVEEREPIGFRVRDWK